MKASHFQMCCVRRVSWCEGLLGPLGAYILGDQDLALEAQTVLDFGCASSPLLRASIMWRSDLHSPSVGGRCTKLSFDVDDVTICPTIDDVSCLHLARCYYNSQSIPLVIIDLVDLALCTPFET